MPTEKWAAGVGQGLTWGYAFTTATLNSIASGNAIASDLTIANGTSLDLFCDLSLSLASAAFVSPNYIGIYLYPLNKDGSTYGDGRFAASAAGPPGYSYWVGNIGLVAATQAQTGVLTRILMPPGTFKFVLYNSGGVALASSGNNLYYRTYDRGIT